MGLTIWCNAKFNESAERLLADGTKGHRLIYAADRDASVLATGKEDPALATALVERAAGDPGLEAAGLMTHFATADEEGDTFMDEQLARFTAWAAQLYPPDHQAVGTWGMTETGPMAASSRFDDPIDVRAAAHGRPVTRNAGRSTCGS